MVAGSCWILLGIFMGGEHVPKQAGRITSLMTRVMFQLFQARFSFQAGVNDFEASLLGIARNYYLQ